jgi:hypothetical protein
VPKSREVGEVPNYAVISRAYPQSTIDNAASACRQRQLRLDWTGPGNESNTVLRKIKPKAAAEAAAQHSATRGEASHTEDTRNQARGTHIAADEIVVWVRAC